jgi:hypothetical protein
MVATFIDELRSTGEKEPLTRRLGKASLAKIVEIEQPVGFVLAGAPGPVYTCEQCRYPRLSEA